MSEPRLRNWVIGAGIASFAATFAAYRLLERPELGLGHLYYVGIVLLAVAGGTRVGAVAGLVATGLYAVGIFLNPYIATATIPTVATCIRLVSYVLVGSLVGYYSSRSRTSLAHAAELAEELRILARRDVVTGLPNQRGFQIAIAELLEQRDEFVLIVCQVPEAPAGVGGMDWLLSVGDRLTYCVPGGDVFRLSDHQFAVLSRPDERVEPRVLATRIEESLRQFSQPVAGWSRSPLDGADALALYTAASERMYARAVARGERPVVTPLRAS